MRIEVGVDDRIGCTRGALEPFQKRELFLRAVEVIIEHIYIDVPEIDQATFETIREELLATPGVTGVAPIDLLPMERRRLQFHTLLAAVPFPILAVNGAGMVTSMNVAARQPDSGFAPREGDCSLDAVIGKTGAKEVRECLANHVGAEVHAGELLYMMTVLEVPEPDRPDDADYPGALLVFRPASQLGEDLFAIQKRGISGLDDMVGNSEATRAVKRQVERFARLDAPLLVLGETGTGKELVARACHRLSDRASKPFLALNCAALPENLVESELFGYAPGAFSGASRSGKPGLLDLANHGNVFLDEIGELSPYVQAKLLRFLQDGTFRRIGGKSESRVDVRIIAATHRDLEAMVETGEFREDLYYRLAVLVLPIPPLAQRREDIPTLARHLVRRAADQIGVEPPPLGPEIIEGLVAEPWPGNVRQLESVLFRAVAISAGAPLSLNDVLPPRETVRPPALNGKAGPIVIGPDESLTAAMERFERAIIEQLYAEHASTRKLAQRCGISHTAAAKRLHKYGIA